MNKDEPMDRLLERGLRVRVDVRPSDACLDPETLAAWMDGTLAPAERAAAETHAADCDRCLAMVSAVARTAPGPPPATRPSWLSLRWLVPLATGAAAVATWMLVQPPAMLTPSSPDSTLADAAKEERPAIGAPEPAQSRTDALEKKAEAPAAKEQDLSRRRADAAPPKRSSAENKVDALKPSAAEPEARPASPLTAAKAAPNQRAELADERTKQTFSAAAAPGLIVVSQDSTVRWRLAGHIIERSIDGGKTWQRLTTGTEIDLLAGSSPSANVCWVTGRAGLVLRTTDGTTWRRLTFPDPTPDLVAVTASSDLSATVTTSNGRTYRTTDGGRTWSLQENPAAPF
jgi:hypothetical protein